MANVWERGDSVRMKVVFDNGATPPVATDPTDVFFRLYQPNLPVITYHYGVDSQLVRDSAGTYHVDFKIVVFSQHDYQFEGVGVVDRTKTGSFDVQRTNF